MGKSPQFAYPVQPQVQEDGRVLVTFPDVPETLTDGATVVEAALNVLGRRLVVAAYAA